MSVADTIESIIIVINVDCSWSSSNKTFYISLNRKHINESFSNDSVEFHDHLYANHFNLVTKNRFYKFVERYDYVYE